ncbi:MAG: HAMP domain-containing protein [Verrucomicrobia bacterium]|nr:HAMP domain-containing protein [Verrucomicrobiota bacterium]
MLSAATLNLFEETDPNGFYYGIWSRSGTLVKGSTNRAVALERPLQPGAGTRIYTQTRAGSREAFQFTELGDCLLAGRPIQADLRAMRRFAGWLWAAGGGVLALGLGGGWVLASRALQPVADISAAATRISAGHLAERINVAETDSELGRLAGVLNSTFARLEAAFAQQKQFTADASHELRTPIAVILAEAQTTLARERSAAEYRETIEVCLAAAQQMRRLTQSLLELARFDAGQEEIARAPVALDEVVRTCADLIQPLAEARGNPGHRRAGARDGRGRH